MRSVLLPALVARSLALACARAPTLVGCASAPTEARPCPEACPTGQTCLVGRCRAPDAPPSPPDTRRVFLRPTDLAVITSSAQGTPGAPVPETLALGRARDGTVALLLRFTASWRDDAEVMSAFVVLDPLDGTFPAAEAASVESARILEPWRSAAVTWGRQPRLDLPVLVSTVRPRAGQPVRIDVTPLVRDWGRRLPDDHGIALIVQGKDAIGGAYAMGVTTGNGPRLEAYVR